jgi:hypothetical protein
MAVIGSGDGTGRTGKCSLFALSIAGNKDVMTTLNKKSDVPAKKAFAEELRRRGFDDVQITSSPADITARKGTEIHYFEIKYTERGDQYFGAATLTEWEAALENEAHYKFVIAMKRDEAWVFQEYSPDEFIKFSSIPPFKIYFNIPISIEKATKTSRVIKRVILTRERIRQMIGLFGEFRGKTGR